MVDYFVHYDPTTGQPAMRGSGPDGSYEVQPIADGMAIAKVPFDVVAGPEISLEGLRAHGCNTIDGVCGIARRTILTTLDGQDTLYARKEAAARRFVAGEGASPLLTHEAELRDMTVEAFAHWVLERAAECDEQLAAVEQRRIGGKLAVAAADTFGAIIAAYVTAVGDALAGVRVSPIPAQDTPTTDEDVTAPVQ